MNGIDAIKYECDILEALNVLDEDYMRIDLEVMFIDEDTKLALKANLLSCIQNRKRIISTHRSEIDRIQLQTSPKDQSNDAFEYLFNLFKQEFLPKILTDIETDYEHDIDTMMTQSAVHFISSAKKIAKYNLRAHLADHSVEHYINKNKIQKLEEALSLMAKNLLPMYTSREVIEIIDKTHNYYSEQMKYCLEIGNKIRLL